MDIVHKHTGKILRTVPENTLRDIILTGADLTGADLTDADLTGAVLRAAILRGAILTGANLTNADLARAVLTNADLVRADLVRAVLVRAVLTGADLAYADLAYADLRWCKGNGKEIRNIDRYAYDITYTHDTLAIGCKQYSITDWQHGNIKLARADKKLWEKHGPAILAHVAANPATGG